MLAVRNIWFALLFTLTACRAEAAPLRATVTHVADGDSFYARDTRGRKLEIRILAIDAPERSQPYADASRQALIRMIRGKEIEIHVAEPDRHGRLVSRVTQRGVDVGLAQLQNGMAWLYGRAQFVPPGYREAERKARSSRLGLWKDPKPVEPWRYRRTPSVQNPKSRIQNQGVQFVITSSACAVEASRREMITSLPSGSST